jgi:IS4 transposase
MAVTDEEVMEIYRCRWGIELLWKFLKMHLKLDKLITNLGEHVRFARGEAGER